MYTPDINRELFMLEKQIYNPMHIRNVLAGFIMIVCTGKLLTYHAIRE